MTPILPEFYHELTHAYEYYLKLKQGVSTYNLRDNSTYRIQSLQAILKNPKLKPLEKNLAIFFYFCDPTEYNGRLNTFYGEIYNQDIKNNDYKTIIRNTKTWKRISFLYNVISHLKNVENQQDQQKLIAIANTVNKQGYDDYQNLLDDVEQRYQKLQNDSVKDFIEIINNLKNKKR